jgi:hypothetical protein
MASLRDVKRGAHFLVIAQGSFVEIASLAEVKGSTTGEATAHQAGAASGCITAKNRQGCLQRSLQSKW